MMTQKEKLRKAFTAGRSLTAKQIQAQFRIASPYKVVSLLRREDKLPITATEHVNKSGVKVAKYSMNTSARKSAVAA